MIIREYFNCIIIGMAAAIRLMLMKKGFSRGRHTPDYNKSIKHSYIHTSLYVYELVVLLKYLTRLSPRGSVKTIGRVMLPVPVPLCIMEWKYAGGRVSPQLDTD